MARYTGPRFKQCRRLGVNTCGHPKAMNRANSPAFAKRKKPTDYSRQLTEKQKLRAYYGILEKQMRRYFVSSDLREVLTMLYTASVSATQSDLLVSSLHTDTSSSMARRSTFLLIRSRSAMSSLSRRSPEAMSTSGIASSVTRHSISHTSRETKRNSQASSSDFQRDRRSQCRSMTSSLSSSTQSKSLR